MQGPFSVAVYAPPQGPGFWDLARDHYGSHTPMPAYRLGEPGDPRRRRGAGRRSASCRCRRRTRPIRGGGICCRPTTTAPHVIARLPFGGRGNARSDGADALAIGRGAQQPTGHDRTLLATENAPDISRGRLFSILAGLGLRCTFIASCEHAEGGNTLIEIDGFVAADDPRLDRFRAQLGAALYRLLPLGGYAVPLSAAELAAAGCGACGAAAVPAVRREAEPMTSPTAPVPGPGILDIAPYVGGEAKAAGVERPIRLASNESALGPEPEGDRRLPRARRRHPPLSRRQRRRIARGARPASTGSTRRASSAAPARTS